MFCLKCGKEIDDNAMRCPYCNCPTENAGETIGEDVIDPTAKSAQTLGIVSIVLGGLGIVWAWFFAIFGWGLGGVGLALALVGQNKNQYVKTCKIGIILSAVTLGCSLINSLIGIAMML